MSNPNALIAMAQIAQNPGNPYDAFCEYIKYCVFANMSEIMTLSEIRENVAEEFGLYIPHNILLKCLSHLEAAGFVSYDRHQIRRTGEFNTETFNESRERYRIIETAIIKDLVGYAAKYNRVWSETYARELLIKTLDHNGLAYDIFLHEGKKCCANSNAEVDLPEIDDFLRDDEAEIEENDQPLFQDVYFVGKYIEEVLGRETIQKDYLRKICEGLMLCVGTYQLPSQGSDASAPQIAGTEFFFDTKLLLRFVGCAGDAAVSAAKELVSLIQNAGGKIYYYPQTFDEMDRALSKAAERLSANLVPHDEEMRLYSASVRNNVVVVAAKRASLKDELGQHRINAKNRIIQWVPNKNCE